MSAATATLMALYRRRITGEGCHIEASAYEAMATQLVSALASCAFDRPPPSRSLSEVQEAATGGVVSAVGGILPCNDGYVAISPREDAQWERWVELMGSPEWASEERFVTRDGRESNFAELWELVGEWTEGTRSKHDIARMGQERRIPCFPVNTVHDLFNDLHLKEREFFTTIEHPVARRAPVSLECRIDCSSTPLPLAERPAPMLGQHNDIYLREGFKYHGHRKTTGLPLEGVRVLDLSWIIAGPTATRFLALMGAEVIKVGSARRPDPSTRGAPFQAYNQSKLYAALNISRPEGLGACAAPRFGLRRSCHRELRGGRHREAGTWLRRSQAGKAGHHHALVVRHGTLRALTRTM